MRLRATVGKNGRTSLCASTTPNFGKGERLITPFVQGAQRLGRNILAAHAAFTPRAFGWLPGQSVRAGASLEIRGDIGQASRHPAVHTGSSAAADCADHHAAASSTRADNAKPFWVGSMFVLRDRLSIRRYFNTCGEDGAGVSV